MSQAPVIHVFNQLRVGSMVRIKLADSCNPEEQALHGKVGSVIQIGMIDNWDDSREGKAYDVSVRFLGEEDGSSFHFDEIEEVGRIRMQYQPDPDAWPMFDSDWRPLQEALWWASEMAMTLDIDVEIWVQRMEGDE